MVKQFAVKQKDAKGIIRIAKKCWTFDEAKDNADRMNRVYRPIAKEYEYYADKI